MVEIKQLLLLYWDIGIHSAKFSIERVESWTTSNVFQRCKFFCEWRRPNGESIILRHFQQFSRFDFYPKKIQKVEFTVFIHLNIPEINWKPVIILTELFTYFFRDFGGSEPSSKQRWHGTVDGNLEKCSKFKAFEHFQLLWGQSRPNVAHCSGYLLSDYIPSLEASHRYNRWVNYQKYYWTSDPPGPI